MARRKPRRKARRNSGVKPWVKVMVTGYVGPSFLDSGWNTLPVYVWDPSGEASAGDVLRAVRRTMGQTEVTKLSIGEVSRAASVPDTMWPQHTVDLKGEWYDWKRAKKNPRRARSVGSSYTRSPASDSGFRSSSALSQPGISPSLRNDISQARTVLSTTGAYPSGEPIRSLSEAPAPTYQRELPSAELVREVPSFLPAALPGAPPGRLTGGSYLRQSLASQPGIQTSQSKLMRQLIDPQLWRLADGGDEWAMHELERRGPAHYRPARPNPGKANPNTKKKGMSQKVASFFKHGGEQERAYHRRESSERRAEVLAEDRRLAARARRKREKDKLVGSTGMTEAQLRRLLKKNPPHPSFLSYVGQRERSGERRIGLMARLPRMSWEDLQAMAGAGGPLAQLATYELEYRKQLTKKRHGSRRVANPRATKNPAARGFEFMHADDNEYWAEWAMARQGIPHRGQGTGPGAWPVGAQANPKLAAFVSGGRGLRCRDLTYKTGLPPAPPISRARPGYGAFLKAGTTSWPAWKRGSGWEHATVAIQYMTRGVGIPQDYPAYIVKLAHFLPPSNPATASIWEIYTRNLKKIEAKHGGPMPEVDQLRKVR